MRSNNIGYIGYRTRFEILKCGSSASHNLENTIFQLIKM